MQTFCTFFKHIPLYAHKKMTHTVKLNVALLKIMVIVIVTIIIISCSMLFYIPTYIVFFASNIYLQICGCVFQCEVK